MRKHKNQRMSFKKRKRSRRKRKQRVRILIQSTERSSELEQIQPHPETQQICPLQQLVLSSGCGVKHGGTWPPCVMSHLALMRYWATPMLAGEPLIVTWRMAEPSVALAILMCAPETWRISLILLPCLPIMQPINQREEIESM